MSGELFSSIRLRCKVIKMMKDDSRKLLKCKSTEIRYKCSFLKENRDGMLRLLKDITLGRDRCLKKTLKDSNRRNLWEHLMRKSEAWTAWIRTDLSNRKKKNLENKDKLQSRKCTISKWLRFSFMPNREKSKRNNGKHGRKRIWSQLTKIKWIKRSRKENLRDLEIRDMQMSIIRKLLKIFQSMKVTLTI